MSKIYIKEDLNRYFHSLKTQDEVKKIFNAKAIEETLFKNRFKGLIGVGVSFIVGIAFLIAGAFINKGDNQVTNPAAITCIFFGLLFIVLVAVPFYVVSFKNREIMDDFIQKNINLGSVFNIVKNTSNNIRNFSTLSDFNLFKNDQTLIFKINDEKFMIKIFENNKIELRTEKNEKISEIELKKIHYFKMDLDLNLKVTKSFSKLFIDFVIEDLSAQIDLKTQNIYFLIEDLLVKKD